MESVKSLHTNKTTQVGGGAMSNKEREKAERL
jgi:hypothetical protein